MKYFKNTSFVVLFAIFAFSVMSCNSDDDNGPDIEPNDPNGPAGACTVQLFDGDNYSDDNIIVEGPGEFPTLENLPGANKDWNNEADSFKAGENAIVTLWTQTEFRGDSIVFEAGAQEPSIDEPSSMKIRCR